MVKRIVLILVIVTLVLFTSLNLMGQTQEVPKKAIKLVEKAADDIKSKKLDKAKEKLEEAKALAPEYAPVYQHLAILSQVGQNLDEAVALMAKAHELDPASEGITQQYATLLLRLAQQKMAQDPAATMKLYETFALLPGIKSKMSPQFIQVAYTLAGQNLQGQNADKAILFASEVLSTPGIEGMPQQHLFSYFMLGSAYGQKGDAMKSVENLKAFLEKNQNNIAPANFVGLANYLIASTHYDKLEKEVEGMKKEDLEGIKKLAETYTEMVDYLNRALAADPANKEAKFSLAKYHYYCQGLDKAQSLLDELLAADPGNSDFKQVKDIVTKAMEAKSKSKKK